MSSWLVVRSSSVNNVHTRTNMPLINVSVFRLNMDFTILPVLQRLIDA